MPQTTSEGHPLADIAFVESAGTNLLLEELPRNEQPSPRLGPKSSNTELPSFSSQSRKYNFSTFSPNCQGILKGWRRIIFGSWLNVLIIFLPISWTLSLTHHKAHNLVFFSCILSLVPLVKLHDLSTRELAIRIGGNKTGLLNATMSNMVEIVFAISALRKCELRVVQSALIGSILSKHLLVLGLCFFAGGLRFSEQGFDATATQIHSSLMTISVAAILLPVAYHFTLAGSTGDSVQQSKNILDMSHGVSIILLFIYGAYMLFQLWSHPHLYRDGHNQKSQKMSVKVPSIIPKETSDLFKNAGKRFTSTILSSKPINHTACSPSRRLQCNEIACSSSTSVKSPNYSCSLDNDNTSTTQLINSSTDEFPLVRKPTPTNHHEINVISAGNALGEESHHLPTSQNECQKSCSTSKEPRLSWTLTLSLMVTIAIFIAITAEFLVESMEGVSSIIGKEWVGLILLPSVTAIAECITAVNVSVRDQLTLSISVAVGSSIQTALFVFPFMVTLAWATNKPLSLLLDPYQSLVLYLSVQVTNHVVADGKSNWLEGVILVCLYLIIAVSFWFYPGSTLPDSLAACSV